MRRAVTGLLLGLAIIFAAASSWAADTSQQAPARDLVTSVAQQVYRCWSPPVSAQGEKGIVVRLHIYLSVDGRLTAPPTSVEQLDTGNPDVNAALRAATRAIYACAPYKLPADQYFFWKEIVITFDPRSL